jgi:hypothetical protein
MPKHVPLPTLLLSSLLACAPLAGQVVINEFQATTSTRVLKFDANGRSSLGCDVPWYAFDYQKPLGLWTAAPGPFGYGNGFTSGTNLSGSVAGKAMGFYLRREFTLTASQAASPDPLRLAIDFDDGFVAYLNGVEVARRNLGPNGAFVYYDQQTYNNRPGGTTENIQVAATASSLLRSGKNVLALQVMNNARAEGFQNAPDTAPGGGNMRCIASLGTTGTVPATLVATTDVYDYFPAIHEPSGGLLDPGLLAKTAVGPNWSQVDYVDTTWGTVNGAMGFEFDATGDYLDQMGSDAQAKLGLMRNVSLAVFGRCEFTLTQAEYDALSTITLNTDWDDGYGLYVNGTEVDRQNVGGLPGQLIPFNTSATAHGTNKDGGGRTSRPAIYRNIPLTKAMLRVGKNVIAAQLHNNGLSSSDLLLDVQMSITGAGSRTLITRNTPWKYVIPTTEIGSVPTFVAHPFEFHDWVELKNTTPNPVALGGWTLTDSRSAPTKWTFPAGTSIPANGFLVVCCSGNNITTPAALGRLHTNFSLASSGEYLGLRNAAGAAVSEVQAIPDQDYFHTWGIDSTASAYRFHNVATPGAENSQSSGANSWASEVEFSHETGYYNAGINITLSTLTPGASIRYTTDGSEPTLTNGLNYTAPIPSNSTIPISTQGPGSGKALREVWPGAGWPMTQASGTAPTNFLVPRFENPGGQENYSNRIRGFLHVPTTGSYTFYIAADDPGEFYLSTDATAANRVRRCWVDSWCLFRDFAAQRQTYGGAPGDTSAHHPNQRSVAVTLTAGQRYYFEANQTEWSGGDHLSVAWTGPGISTITVIEGNFLSPPDVLPTNIAVAPYTAVIRAKAWAPQKLPSETRTRNYSIAYSTAIRNIPAIYMTGAGSETFYKGNGVFSISGGSYNTDTNWVPGNVGTDYNFMIMHGQPFERPATFEVIQHGQAEPLVRTNVGLRSAGSPWSRPKYINAAVEDPIWGANFDTHNKPQMNIHFRGDIGIKKLKKENFIPGSIVDEWDNLRIRAGKNDAFNPLIIDEFCRRSFRCMGRNPAPIGFFANVFLNGSWKGLFNPTERPREPFFQEFFQTQNLFDTVYIGSFEDGDNIAFNAMFSFFGTNDFSTLANYNTGKTHWNVENVADYIALHGWTATNDFPGNNYAFTRERAPGGLWHFSMWDAEGSFNTWGQAPDYDAFANLFGINDLTNAGIVGEGGYVRRVVRRFCQSPEFRLLVADRIHKHYNNGGCMSSTALNSRYTELRNLVSPSIQAAYNAGFSSGFWDNWAVAGAGRTSAFLTHARTYGMWPTTTPASFSQFGGTINAGSPLTLSNPNGAGTVYYTTDGTDPRAVGGSAATAALTYSTPLSITSPVTVKARVLNAGVWSALTEADFAPPPPSVVFSEIHYNPPGAADATEFIELLNISSQPANLSGAQFTDGIDYTFGNNVILAPGARLVLISEPTNLAAFQARYPGVAIHGHYGGELSNNGETITLRDTTGAIICTLTYADSADLAWAAAAGADGDGATLVLKNPESLTSTTLSNPNLWRRSVAAGGAPGSVDSMKFTAPSILTDTDKDGVTSLVEYALGTTDTTPNSRPDYAVEMLPDGEMALTASFDGRTDDITIEGIMSTNISGWTAMPMVGEMFDDPPGKVTRTWQATPPAGATRLFFKLRVTKN